jgi:polyhydroxybutyrate depolymerase
MHPYSLTEVVRQTLDRALGRDPAWADSRAAQRAAELDRGRRRWLFPVLAVALIGGGGAAALLVEAPNQPSSGPGAGAIPSRSPSATSSAPASSPALPATPSPSTRADSPSPDAGLVIGGDRPVSLHLPSPQPGTPAPLILLLHGYSGSAGEIEGYVRLARVAAARGILLAAPEGTVDGDGNRFWNATDVCCDLDHSGIDDAGYLADLIDEIQTVASVDPKRIYLVGYSNGGFMSYRMACEHADVVAAMVSLAGASFARSDDCRPTEPVAVLQIHGTADEFVRFDGGELSEVIGSDGVLSTYPGALDTATAWAVYDGCAPELVEVGEMVDVDAVISGPSGPAEASVVRATHCEPGGHVELWTIPDGGHFPNLAGAFAETLVDFLLAHPKP